jgi:pimeloyl-ACP methyl ester carboxylesterase
MRPNGPVAFALLSLLACAASPPPAVRPRPVVQAPVEGFVDGPRGRIRVDDGGAGALAPVLFVHGNGSDRSVWLFQLAHLRPSRRAVAFDLPGFGESPAPRGGDFSVTAMAAEIGTVADALGLERFVLVGHSYAGMLITAYAASHPERVAGLVYLDAMLDGQDASAAEWAEQVRALEPERIDKSMEDLFTLILAEARAATRDQVMQTLQRTAPSSLRGAMLSSRDFDGAAALARYRGPRAAVAARRFERFGVQARIPGMDCTVVSGVSHWLMLDDPGAVNRALDGVLLGML